jgi:hypothetical protein
MLRKIHFLVPPQFIVLAGSVRDATALLPNIFLRQAVEGKIRKVKKKENWKSEAA